MKPNKRIKLTNAIHRYSCGHMISRLSDREGIVVYKRPCDNCRGCSKGECNCPEVVLTASTITYTRWDRLFNTSKYQNKSRVVRERREACEKAERDRHLPGCRYYRGQDNGEGSSNSRASSGLQSRQRHDNDDDNRPESGGYHGSLSSKHSSSPRPRSRSSRHSPAPVVHPEPCNSNPPRRHRHHHHNRRHRPQSPSADFDLRDSWSVFEDSPPS